MLIFKQYYSVRIPYERYVDDINSKVTYTITTVYKKRPRLYTHFAVTAVVFTMSHKNCTVSLLLDFTLHYGFHILVKGRRRKQNKIKCMHQRNTDGKFLLFFQLQ